MMRRRLSGLGRIALHAAYEAMGDAPPMPSIFASRHGECARSVELLAELSKGEPLSPTSFSVSVHNAIGALFSIARKDVGNYTAVAQGEETVEAAFCEAMGLLADGAPGVLVVVYDQPLPSAYAAFESADAVPHAWAVTLMRTGDEGAGFTLMPESLESHSPTPKSAALPRSLEILRFLVAASKSNSSAASELRFTDATRAWRWSSHV